MCMFKTHAIERNLCLFSFHFLLHGMTVLDYPKLMPEHRLLDSLVVECWLRLREVLGSIPSQGLRHTKDVIKMVPVVPLFSTQH